MKRHQNKLLTDNQHDFLVENIPGKFNQELADMLNDKFGLSLTSQQIKNYKKNHGLASFSGVTGHFPKGYVPVNKGTKGKFNVGGNKTSFKKGHRPANWKPIGSERVDADGYVWIKVAHGGKWNDRWKMKSRVIWEEVEGKIPKNHIIIYKDGNPSNCVIENLLLISRNEHARMNQMKIKRTSEQVTSIALNLAKIAIKKAELKNNQYD